MRERDSLDQEERMHYFTQPCRMFRIPDTAIVPGVCYFELFPRHVRHCLVESLHAASCMAWRQIMECTMSAALSGALAYAGSFCQTCIWDTIKSVLCQDCWA